MQKTIISVYKTNRKQGLYLYIDKLKGLDNIPEQLRKMMTPSVHVMDFLLTAERTLAQIDAKTLQQHIREQGYYLQMPPPEEKDDYAITLPEELLCFNDPE